MTNNATPTPPASGGGGSPADGGAAACSCTVTISPKPVSICGAGTTASLTATGNPAGGTFAWSSSDATIATVSPSANPATVTGVKAGAVTIKVTYTTGGCSPCTDTAPAKVCTCTSMNRYASATKVVANLNAAKAKIKTRYGKLCCEKEGCGTSHALHCTYVNISNESGAVKWAQSGYGRERNAGSAAIAADQYAEINGDGYRIIKVPAPAEGSVHEYKIELDPATGKWSFYFDGTRWQTLADPFWNGKRGTSVQWTGEIHNKEDDMSGTAGNKCNFTECQYRVRGPLVYQDAGFSAGDPHSDDNSEWGAERVSNTAINIWDKNPN